MRTLRLFATPSFLLLIAICGTATGQLDFDRKPICYDTAEPSNRVADLQVKIDSGDLELKHDDDHGYLKAVLEALDVPVSSQMLVFSKTSFQLRRISRRRPRAVYFNDDVYLGWVQRGDVIELSVADDKLGAAFYTLSQDKTNKPQFIRQTGKCMTCHASSKTRRVPGHFVRSVYATHSGQPNYGSGTFTIDHTSEFKNRWGGWYVSGTHGDQRHMGIISVDRNQTAEPFDRESRANTTDISEFVNTKPYLSNHSDIVALMVLEHQTRMHNLITRASFETRIAQHSDIAMNELLGEPQDNRTDSSKRRIKSAAKDLVEYMLYSGEHPLTDRVEGTSGFTKEFTAKGPFDDKGRSLREFDLTTRMMKYPCSHLIYSTAFDRLPEEVKEEIYRQLFDALSGRNEAEEFAHLSARGRKAILEILLATKPDLPEYWRTK